MMAGVDSTSRLKFDDFIKGQRGVVADPTYMTTIKGKGFYQTRDLIADKIQEIFEDLEEQLTAKQVSSYYIDQAILTDDINSLEPKTWTNIPHLYQEWGGLGQDGLIVLAIVTERDVPMARDESSPVMTVDDYSTALCQQLHHLFKIVNRDTRLETNNNNATRTVTSSNSPVNAIVYIAVSLV